MTAWPRGWVPSLVGSATRRADLRHDVTAGIVLTGLLVPAGMGYAEAAGLPAITGLHATVAALIAYALLGPTRILILGPDSALTPLIAAAVIPLAAQSSDRAVALAGLLALLSGGMLVLAGLLRGGLLTDLLSSPIRLGYLHGVALTLVVSQLPKLFGFAADGADLTGTLVAFVGGVDRGSTNTLALVLGTATLVSIAVLRRAAPGLPDLLLVIGGAIALVWLADLQDQLPVVGALPSGLPSPALGGLRWSDVIGLLPAALGIALIASADTTVLSRAIAGDHDGPIDDSHEMASLGVANVACGVLGGFPVSASSSRTPVAMRSGARSQITGIIGAVLVLLLVLAVPGVTALLPSSILAAVVIVAALSLVDLRALGHLWRVRRVEFALAMASFLGVALLGVIRGIGWAVVLSLAVFVSRAWRPYRAELVRVYGRKGYHDVERHPHGRRIPGLIIARFDAPLFFANARVFSEFVRSLVTEASDPVSWVMIAAEPITDVDTTAAEELVILDDELAAQEIVLVFAELKGPVKDRLTDYGLSDRFGDDRFFPTVGSCVSAYIRATDTSWTDWTDVDDNS